MIMTNLSKGNRLREQGFSLIEVLVSLLILGFGLLGLGGLQVASIKSTGNAHSRNVANMLAMELADRMRANPLGVEGGFYAETVTCSTAEKACRINTFCTPKETARFDLQEIMCGMKRGTKREGGVANLLVGGDLKVRFPIDCPRVNQAYEIKLAWGESVISPEQTGSPQDKSLTVCVKP